MSLRDVQPMSTRHSSVFLHLSTGLGSSRFRDERSRLPVADVRGVDGAFATPKRTTGTKSGDS